MRINSLTALLAVPLLVGSAAPSAPRLADLIYVPSVIGDVDGELADDAGAQVRQALDNLRSALAEEGATLTDVAAMNVFLADARDFATMNAIYREYFPIDPPTRATVQADLPNPQALIQIAAIAARPGQSPGRV